MEDFIIIFFGGIKVVSPLNCVACGRFLCYGRMSPITLDVVRGMSTIWHIAIFGGNKLAKWNFTIKRMVEQNLFDSTILREIARL